MKGAF
jgi:hypothetical protein